VSQQFSVEWSDGIRKVTSCDAVRSLLRELHRKFAGHPELVDIVAPSGAVLTVGLGANAAVPSYAESPERPPYYATHGNGAGDGTIWFDYRGSPSEFPIEQVVTVRDAMRAAEEFCKTVSRPTTVEWESV
jgi:hypothetical protein